MSDFSYEKWEAIKSLAARLQAIKNILEVFTRETEHLSLSEDLTSMKQQLEDDFERTLDSLLKLIDNNGS
ncbi:hypothetical protein [Argonema antarcticum]|uniref:hypothetical protein n=1 Tax=Argonema antarcticum TaxID=2942763 RepID=UPI0020114318|nr:hypothetical protein [Argonema antarcticum]MCL1471542.1 hypothetical protein [Argonema antarcticum A004/B2]